MLRLIVVCLFSIFFVSKAFSQTADVTNGGKDAELKFVVYVIRHGVRSPTANPNQYNIYSAASWPLWDVPPGHLTDHGYLLMKMVGQYDRMQLSSQGLISASGCANASTVSIHADSDQRTRETGRALAEGLFPGCPVPVHSLAEGTPDVLFHPIEAGITRPDSASSLSAVAGRIGGSPDKLTAAYRTQITELDQLLSTCGNSNADALERTSLLKIPATLGPGKGDHLVELRGPLYTASTLSENLLLEYTEGMKNVGWGCIDGAKLRSLINLHSSAVDFTQSTPLIAQAQVSYLLNAVHRSLEQAVTGKKIAGAISDPENRVLFLVGHDTNIVNLAGILNLTWIIDGRRDDTPPGGALIFELWKNRRDGGYSLKLFYSAQTLEQMRDASPLSLKNPPERVPLFVPGCSVQDFSCSWESLSRLVDSAIDQKYLKIPLERH